MSYTDAMDTTAKAVEIVGVTIIVVGGVIALVRAGIELLRGTAVSASYRGLRSFLGRSILLGLEVLVAADLIRTVAVEPSLENVAVLDADLGRAAPAAVVHERVGGSVPSGSPVATLG